MDTILVPPRPPTGGVLRRGGRGPRRGAAERGDLYVRLVAELPETDDPRLDELAQELESLYGTRDVRQRLKETP